MKNSQPDELVNVQMGWTGKSRDSDLTYVQMA